MLMRWKHRAERETPVVGDASPALLAVALPLYHQFGAHALAVAYALTGNQAEAETMVVNAFCALADEWSPEDSRPGREQVLARVVRECELRRAPTRREAADGRATAWIRLADGQQTVIALTVPTHLS